jgi:NAD(P)-dependent dehydrogenase (short-subunit alcohol dehydrogenase family)
MSKTIAREFGRDGITSFVLAPGWVKSDMTKDSFAKYGEETLRAEAALGKITEPRDIGPLAVLLASGMADHATGTTIDINAASYVH